MSAHASETLGGLRRALNHLSLADHERALSALAALGPDARALADALAVCARRGAGAGSHHDAFSLAAAGWMAYYQARYDEAAVQFEQAWSLGGPWRSWASLGAGKVASDLGHWQGARAWLLETLARARAEDDFVRLAEAYGALGEVLLRAGRPREAYECFVLDAALLPAGSGHAARLANYQAFCLARLDRPDLAEAMLWASYYGDRDGPEAPSAAYAAASLAVLSVRTRRRALFERVSAATGHLVGDEMPLAFTRMAAAFWAREAGDREQSVDELHAARDLFGSRYPVESFWVTRLLGEPNDGSLARLQARRAPSPPGMARVASIDVHLAAASLDATPPFAELATDDVEALWRRLDLFFI